MTTLFPYAAPVGRVLIALMFLMAGLSKITAYAGTAAYMTSVGVPSVLLPLVIVLEVVGAIFVIIGFQTRFAALALAGFSVLAALLFHNNLGDQNEMTHLMKNFAIAGGFLFLVANGPGKLSIDKS